MKQTPNVYTPMDISRMSAEMQKEISQNLWVPARPMGYPGSNLRRRLVVAWKVFTGQYDAVHWPGQ